MNDNTLRTKDILSVENIQLEGHERLIANKVIRTFEFYLNEDGYMVEKRQVGESTEVISFYLTEITMEEAKNIRQKRIPAFLLKEAGRYYFAKIPTEYKKCVHFIEAYIICDHQCASKGPECCKHLLAAPDELGGCQKVRDKKKRIEEYQFIDSCYQVVGTNSNVFCVCKCSYYEPSDPRPTVGTHDAQIMSDVLKQFVNFETM